LFSASSSSSGELSRLVFFNGGVLACLQLMLCFKAVRMSALEQDLVQK
jgi:hypothetical protein